MPSNAAVVVGAKSVEPGSHEVVRLPVTTDLDGGEVAVWVHVFRGSRPGPTFTLVGVQHGDEWRTVDLMRQLVGRIDPTAIAGTVLVVPVANPIALGAGQRNTQPESDGPNMNRAWPGIHTWLAESISSRPSGRPAASGTTCWGPTRSAVTCSEPSSTGPATRSRSSRWRR